MDAIARVVMGFRREFGGEPPVLVRAPGRVNLIGEHTDYNEGFVLPLAIDRHVWIAARPRPDRRVRLVALDLRERDEFDLSPVPPPGPRFAEYVKGVARALRDDGRELRGLDAAIAGDLPAGSGLSSSAALGVAAARTFLKVAGLPWEPLPAALAVHRAENERVRVACGVMDPLASACGVEGHALFLDCRTLGFRAVPLPAGVAVVVLDTGTRRGLDLSPYNERRAQCEAAARALGAGSLRDVTRESWSWRGEPDPVLVRRARHVVTENARVLGVVAALDAGDAEAAGRLLDEGHESLRRDFEVSCEALDRIVGIARDDPVCLGARLTGAGFGGCAVALVRAGEEERFAAATAARYRAETGRPGAAWPVRAAGGAEIVSP